METTLIPFATLPACATTCGPLFDANGACVPGAVPTASPNVYAQCFCSNAKVTAFSTGTAGVCDGSCDSGALGSIQQWYQGFCQNPATFTGLPANEVQTTGTATATSTRRPIAGNTGGGGSWLSTHWQWVVFLVIMVVAITGIWIGACIWRRRYLRKKDRQYALGKRLGNTNVTASGRNISTGTPAPDGASTRSVHLPSAGMFQPAPISEAGVYGPESEAEKKARNKWNPTERT